MKNKTLKPVPTKGISTDKPTPPAPPATPEPVKYIPVAPKVNAGNIEFEPAFVDEFLTKLSQKAEEAETKEKKTKKTKTDKLIARNIVAKAFPAIKKLLEKGHSKKDIYTIFTDNLYKAGEAKFNFAGFSTAINKQIKAEKEAEAAKQVALNLGEVKEDETPLLSGESETKPTEEELAAEESIADTHPTI